MIKNAKFSGYYFDMNLNIWGDFQICISVLLISPIWNKTLKVWDTLFELIQIEAQCSKNYFKFFLTTRSYSFWKQQRKGTAKATSKYEKYVYYIFTENICSTCSPIQVSVFLQKCINFREKQLKFSDFEDSIIP